MRFLQRMLRISWTANILNEKVLPEVDTRKSLIKRILKRQATIFGHVVRRKRLEHLTKLE